MKNTIDKTTIGGRIKAAEETFDTRESGSYKGRVEAFWTNLNIKSDTIIAVCSVFE